VTSRALLLLASACIAGAQETGYPLVYEAAKQQGGQYMQSFYLPPAPGATPWAPEWSPDGKWIAVAMQGSIWKVDPGTGDATELTYNQHYHSSPAFSPDGKWIVYTADHNQQSIQLEILNVATGQSRELTHDGQVYLDPVFSPDGRMLAYVSTLPGGYMNIYIRKIRDDAWEGQPIAVTTDHKHELERLYVGAWDSHTQPAWTTRWQTDCVRVQSGQWARFGRSVEHAGGSERRA